MTKPNLFQLIDLDRTLFDTSKFAKAITDEVNILHPGMGTELDARFETAYKKEETFFLLRHLRHQMGDLWFEGLVARVIAKYGNDAFLLAGARERLAFADTLGVDSWGILTYGDKIDQHMKLRLIGLGNARVYITRTPNKGEVINSWKTIDGRFQLPLAYGGGLVDTITLEDDKLRAFSNLPSGATGLWIATPGKDVIASRTDMGGDIVPIQNLFESIEYLRAHFI